MIDIVALFNRNNKKEINTIITEKYESALKNMRMLRENDQSIGNKTEESQ